MPLEPDPRRAAIADVMRLQPDKRFLLAVAQLQQLTGGPATAAAARFEAGRWKLAAASEDLGELPEIPDYQDLMAPLTAFAGRHLGP